MPSWMAWEGGCRREILVWHRRAGKDDCQLHKTAVAAHRRVGGYWHCLPEYEQAKKAIWEAVNPMTGIRRIDEAFPPEIRKRTDNHGMVIEFACGSIWRVVGSDNPSSLVGAAPVGICFSEWGLSNPEAWAYLAPILVENGGWASFITTPRGRNHAFSMLEMARKDPWSPENPDGWFSEVLTPAETGFPRDLIEKQRQEYHNLFGEDAGDSLIDQEYWCSFSAAILGSYYGKAIARLEAEGRATQGLYLPGLPVHTAWDLGKGANMWVWCFQIRANQVYVIDAIEGAHDEVIVDICQRLADLGRDKDYQWGDDWVPHDAKVKEHSGRTRIETLISLKRKPRLVPDHKIMDGINAVRVSLPHTWFDVGVPIVAKGLEYLRQYRADWDQDRKVFKNEPFHDHTSHCSDAGRYLAIAWREIKPPPAPKPPGRTIHQLTMDEAWKLRETDMGRRPRI